jgi:hypothetical protein
MVARGVESQWAMLRVVVVVVVCAPQAIARALAGDGGSGSNVVVSRYGPARGLLAVPASPSGFGGRAGWLRGLTLASQPASACLLAGLERGS